MKTFVDIDELWPVYDTNSVAGFEVELSDLERQLVEEAWEKFDLAQKMLARKYKEAGGRTYLVDF